MELYLYEGNGQVTGPHSKQSLIDQVVAGQLGPDTPAAAEGADWKPLHQLIRLPAPVKPQTEQLPQHPFIRKIEDLAILRSRTVYPLMRFVANVVALLGLVAAALIVITTLLQEDTNKLINLSTAAFIAFLAMFQRELQHLGADIADRLHQAGQDRKD